MRKTVLVTIMATAAAPALAQSAGEWRLGAGLQYAMPVDDNGTLGGREVQLDESVRGTLLGEYMLHDDLGIEVHVALPVELTASTSAGKLGSVDQLSVSSLLTAHFRPVGRAAPFLGAGINFTRFYNEDGPAGTSISVEDSWGAALAGGIDMPVGDRGLIRADIRWSDIDADVRVDGTDQGSLKIDPLGIGVAYMLRF